MSNAKRNIFVTTALPYANGAFHFGHILEYIQADIWVRHERMCGNNVHFVCADDAHGAPIMIAASKQGVTPQEFVAKISAGRQQYLDKLSVSIKFWRERGGCLPDYVIKELREAGVESPVDMNHIKLALQGYNYGNGYISWAKENYGGYTYANAVEFSEMMAERNGWSSYGDKEYVSHVLRYYVFGRIPTGTGSQAIVQVALTQEGNGGDIYWSWYGFSSREEWCACFVSWCADQCGYIEAGVIPKFSLCSAGMEWFESRGQFMDGSYVPATGDLVFFDWENDGSVDHVGIVESVVDGNIYTVEGNSGDKVARRSYPIGYGQIVGYGVPAY